MQHFEQLLNIYKGQTFNPKSRHRELCQTVLEDATILKEVGESMRVILPHPVSHIPGGIQGIKDSLTFRVPVYYGKNMTNMFDAKKLTKVCGYTLKDVDNKLDPRIRYTICGRVLATSPGVKNPKIAYLAHCWSVNFESENTYDYQNYTKNGRILRKPYAKLVREMTDMIARAGVYAMEDSDSKRCDLLVPAIGLGAFMGCIESEDDRTWAVQLYVSSLSNIAYETAKHHPGVHLAFFDFGNMADDDLVKATEHANFKIRSGTVDGDIFGAAGKLLKTSPCVCAVNAWDPVSFIGNGLANDPTCDGMFVGGHRPGELFANSSFLHNTALMPSVLNTTQWLEPFGSTQTTQQPAKAVVAAAAAAVTSSASSFPPSAPSQIQSLKSIDSNSSSSSKRGRGRSRSKSPSSSKKTTRTSIRASDALNVMNSRDDENSGNGYVTFRVGQDAYLAPGPVSLLPPSWQLDGVMGCVTTRERPYYWKIHDGAHLMTQDGYPWEVYMDKEKDVDYVVLWRRVNNNNKQTFTIFSNMIRYGHDHNMVINGKNSLARLTTSAMTAFHSHLVPSLVSDESVDDDENIPHIIASASLSSSSPRSKKSKSKSKSTKQMK